MSKIGTFLTFSTSRAICLIQWIYHKNCVLLAKTNWNYFRFFLLILKDKLVDRFLFSILLNKQQLISLIEEISHKNNDNNNSNTSNKLKLEFAVCFVVNADQSSTYWDNNYGLNYQYDFTFKIANQSTTSTFKNE